MSIFIFLTLHGPLGAQIISSPFPMSNITDVMCVPGVKKINIAACENGRIFRFDNDLYTNTKNYDELLTLDTTYTIKLLCFDGTYGYAAGYVTADSSLPLFLIKWHYSTPFVRSIDTCFGPSTRNHKPLSIAAAAENNLWIIGEGGFVAHYDGVSLSQVDFGGIRNFYSVSFIDGSHGWIIGESGCIMNTKNGGRVWMPETRFTQNSLFDIHFADSINGWIAGENGGLWRTINRGQSWIEVKNSLKGDVLNILAFSETYGLVFVRNSGLMESFTGGIIWNPVNGTLPKHSTFIKSSESYFTLNTNAIYSYKGGVHGNLLDSLEGTSFHSIYFVDTLHGWLQGAKFGRSYIMHSNDGGLTWTPQYREIAKKNYNFSFLNADTGYALGDSGSVLFTATAGKQWKPLDWGIGNARLNSLYFQNNGAWWLLGEQGILYRSLDQGKIWKNMAAAPFSDSTGFTKIYFCSAAKGWLRISGAREIYYTDNGGVNWKIVPPYVRKSVELQYVENIYVIDSNVLICEAHQFSSDNLAVSVDNGKTWKGSPSSWRPGMPVFLDTFRGWHEYSTFHAYNDFNYPVLRAESPSRTLFFTDACHGWEFLGNKLQIVKNVPYKITFSANLYYGWKNLEDTLIIKWKAYSSDTVVIAASYDNGQNYSIVKKQTANDGYEKVILDSAIDTDVAKIRITEPDGVILSESETFAIHRSLSSVSKAKHQNPASRFTINGSLLCFSPQQWGFTEIELFAMSGKAVFQRRIPAKGCFLEQRIPLGKMPAGIYCLKFRQGDFEERRLVPVSK